MSYSLRRCSNPQPFYYLHQQHQGGSMHRNTTGHPRLGDDVQDISSSTAVSHEPGRTLHSLNVGTSLWQCITYGMSMLHWHRGTRTPILFSDKGISDLGFNPAPSPLTTIASLRHIRGPLVVISYRPSQEQGHRLTESLLMYLVCCTEIYRLLGR